MSDLFAPMPLPDRPVQQTADIAERDAANKQKEIDTRMRERLETSRLQSIHEIGVAREGYQTSLKKLEWDYRKSVTQSPSSFARETRRAATAKYQKSRGLSDDRAEYVAENARLHAQHAGFEVGLEELKHRAIAMQRENRWSVNQTMEWVEPLVHERIMGLSFTGNNANLSGVNNEFTEKLWKESSSVMSWIIKEAYETSNGIQATATVERAKKTFGEATAQLTSEYIPGDALSLDLHFNDDPAFIMLERVMAEGHPNLDKSKFNWRKEGTEQWKELQRAWHQRTVNGLFREVTTLLAGDKERFNEDGTIAKPGHPTAYAGHAMAYLLGTKLYQSVDGEWDLNENDIRKDLDNRLTVAVADHNARVDIEQGGFLQAYSAGNYINHKGTELFDILASYGFTVEEQWDFIQKHDKNRLDQPYMIDKSATEREHKRNQEEVQTQNLLDMQNLLLAQPLRMANVEEIRLSALRMEIHGLLPQGSTGDLIKNFATPGNAALMEDLIPVKETIKYTVNILRSDKNTWEKAGSFSSYYPKLKDPLGQSMSVVQLQNTLYRFVEDRYLNPEDGARPTIETVADMANQMLRSYTKKYELTDDTLELIGQQTQSPGGDAIQRTYIRQEEFPGQTLRFSRPLMEELTDDPAELARFDAMEDWRKPQASVDMLQLAGYTGTAEDDRTHAEMTSSLNGLRMSGHIWAYELNRGKRSLKVQLANHGQWYVRDLFHGDREELLRTANKHMFELASVLDEVEDALANGASLTGITAFPDGTEVEVGSSVIDVFTNLGENAYNAFSDIARWIDGTTSNFGSLGGGFTGTAIQAGTGLGLYQTMREARDD